VFGSRPPNVIDLLSQFVEPFLLGIVHRRPVPVVEFSEPIYGRGVDARPGPVDVRVVGDVATARAVADLFVRVWDAPPSSPPMRSEVIRALAMSGGYVSAAWLDGQVVGGSVGWLGQESHGLTLHSHLTGSDPALRGAGVGLALKRHQRAWALAHGITEVRWTFDPLVRRNAWFNLTKLGVDVASYEVDFYGPLVDGINDGDESDRAIVVWQLQGPRAVAAAADQLDGPDVGALQSTGAHVVLGVDGRGAPEPGSVHGRNGSPRLCAAPADIEGLRRTDPTLAREWRVALRAALGRSIDDGWRVAGISRDGWYVLEPPESPA
jgi:predicted GNAT superfamily acetyltransferase